MQLIGNINAPEGSRFIKFDDVNGGRVYLSPWAVQAVADARDEERDVENPHSDMYLSDRRGCFQVAGTAAEIVAKLDAATMPPVPTPEEKEEMERRRAEQIAMKQSVLSMLGAAFGG